MKGGRQLRDLLYWWLYPGINLHARLRYKLFPRHFRDGGMGDGSLVLDAGSGNGMLSYQSYRLGGRTVGVSIQESEVLKSRRLFNEYLGIPEQMLRFEECSLYKLDYPENYFDVIVCAEVLEHLRHDRDVCSKFYQILKPGGVAHICAPNANHPYNKEFPLDVHENGGHVRPGYTEQSYRDLLEPLGFRVERLNGFGGPIRQAFNRRIKEIQSRFGPVAGVPLYFVALVFLIFERKDLNPETPFSIYVRARKPSEAM